MSDQFLNVTSPGYSLAHMGETHKTVEEAKQHEAENSGFKPPIIHSEFVTGLIIVGLAIVFFMILQWLKASFTISYLVTILILILLSAVYVISAPAVTAIVVGFGFLLAFLITLASM